MPVNSRHPDHDAQSAKILRVRDSLDADSVKAAGETYLPKPSGMKAAKYKSYVQRALYYGATERTLQGISGLVFRRQTQAEAPAGQFAEDLLLNVDQRGTSYDRFTQTVFDEVFTSGRCGVYCSLPTTPTQGARARLSTYRFESIINWEEIEQPDGSPKTTRVVLEESRLIKTPDDAYSMKRITQWRDVCIHNGRVLVTIWRKSRDVAGSTSLGHEFSPVLVAEPVFRGQPLREIPFVAINPRSLGLHQTEKPPLLPLADANLYHWGQMADRRHAEHNVAAATGIYITADGVKPKEVEFGGGTVLTIPKSDAKVGLLEYSGQGLNPLRDGIEDTVGYMATLGARLLEVSKRAPETAETHRLRQGREQATVAGTVQTINSGMSRAATMLLNLSGQPGDAEIHANTDLVDAKMQPDEIRSQLEALQTGALPYEVFWANLQRGEIAPVAMGHTEAREAVAAERDTSLPVLPEGEGEEI